RGRSLIPDGDDLEGLGAARRRDLHDVALGLADQRARDRRAVGDATRLDVGLVLADDLVARLVPGILVGDLDGRAEHDLAARVDRGRVDDLAVRELRLDVRDAALDEALLLARGVVLRVLLQVAVRARLRDG